MLRIDWDGPYDTPCGFGTIEPVTGLLARVDEWHHRHISPSVFHRWTSPLWYLFRPLCLWRWRRELTED